MYKFWYIYVKPRCRSKAKLCYLDTYSFIVYIKTENIYVDIEKGVGTRFHTSNYELEKPLPKGNNTKVIGLMKDEQITKEFVGLRAKTCSYVIDDGSKDKKGKATKKYVNKKIIKTL